MKLLSWNVNGIRAVERKGALKEFLDEYDPDVLLIQEIKAKEDQLGKIIKDFSEYKQFYHSAEKPGYSGTSIWVHESIEGVTFDSGLPGYDDNEGRVARMDVDNNTILGIYFPNGGKSQEAWDDKLVFFDKFLEYVNDLRKSGRNVIWTGDINAAHEEIDLARPKDNLTSIGFRPEERAWVGKVIENGWTDVFRKMNPDKVKYSWWHMISRARDRNVGWRIDYFFIDEKQIDNVNDMDYLNEQFGSDHCPVLLDINI